jgi:exopolysaccharide biosynthesis polyprenyl glycosylphosphotransferase
LLRERAKLIEATLYLLDMSASAAAFLATYWIRKKLSPSSFPPLLPISQYLNLILLIIPIWTLCFRFSKLYRSYRTSTIYRECMALIKVVIICGLILGFAIFIVKEHMLISRSLIVGFLILNIFFLILLRVAIRAGARYARKRGYNFRNMIIVGDDIRAFEFARMVERTRGWGIKILGFVTMEPDQACKEIKRNYRLFGAIDNLKEIVLKEVVDEVVFLVTRKKLDELEDLFLFLEDVGINARVALNLFPNVIARTYVSSLRGIPLLSFSTIPRDGVPLMIKAAMDRLLSALLLIVLSPLLLMAAVLVKATSHGPVIWTQVRCGLNGRKFIMYKFRSMVADADEKKKMLTALNEMDGPVFKMKNDPRITSIGRWLRKTSLDELPQLFNVLKGDMSLVGPRPALPEEVEQYERWQRRRLSMKPGLTCLWQIDGRNQVDFEHWMKMDLDYIDNWRLELDFKILLKTIPVILSCKGM